MSPHHTQTPPRNKLFWEKTMKTEFKKAALGVVLMTAGIMPLSSGLSGIWDLRDAVTPEQIAAHPSFESHIKACQKKITSPDKQVIIPVCAERRATQDIIAGAPAYTTNVALSVGGFIGWAGGLLLTVSSAGAGFDARRKYQSIKPG